MSSPRAAHDEIAEPAKVQIGVARTFHSVTRDAWWSRVRPAVVVEIRPGQQTVRLAGVERERHTKVEEIADLEPPQRIEPVPLVVVGQSPFA
jgi:hypothetical protein